MLKYSQAGLVHVPGVPLFITSRMRCLLKKFAAMNQAAASDHCYRRTYPARERDDAFSQRESPRFSFLFFSQASRRGSGR